MQIHVPTDTADKLLAKAGITECRETSSRGIYSSWTLPNGRPRSEGGIFGQDYLWEKDEAVGSALAIIAGTHE